MAAADRPRKIQFELFENGVQKKWTVYQRLPREVLIDAIGNLVVGFVVDENDLLPDPMDREGTIKLDGDEMFPASIYTATLADGLPFLDTRHVIRPDHPNRRWERAGIRVEVLFVGPATLRAREEAAREVARRADNSAFAKKLALANSGMKLHHGPLAEIMKFQDPTAKLGPWPKGTFTGANEAMSKALEEVPTAETTAVGRGRRTKRRMTKHRTTQKRRT